MRAALAEPCVRLRTNRRQSCAPITHWQVDWLCRGLYSYSVRVRYSTAPSMDEASSGLHAMTTPKDELLDVACPYLNHDGSGQVVELECDFRQSASIRAGAGPQPDPELLCRATGPRWIEGSPRRGPCASG